MVPSFDHLCEPAEIFSKVPAGVASCGLVLEREGGGAGVGADSSGAFSTPFSETACVNLNLVLLCWSNMHEHKVLTVITALQQL